MTDRLGKTFIFTCDGYATEVLNSLPLEAFDLVNNMNSVDFETWRFSVENYVENVESEGEFISKCLNSKEKTHGLYKRGII